MNIFVLQKSPTLAARDQCDQHVCKMPCETAQMLSTAHRVISGKEEIVISPTGRRNRYWRLHDEREDTVCKAAFVNHPCSIWARESLGNFVWLYDHGIALCNEYEHRFNRVHGSKIVIQECMDQIDRLNLTGLATTDFAICMPDEFKRDGAIESYRQFYISDKSRFARWTTRSAPSWYLNGVA